jgi:hypothetical protein
MNCKLHSSQERLSNMYYVIGAPSILNSLKLAIGQDRNRFFPDTANNTIFIDQIS